MKPRQYYRTLLRSAGLFRPFFRVSFSIDVGAKINGAERENMQRMQICKAQNVPDIPSELLNCPMQVCKVIYDIVQIYQRVFGEFWLLASSAEFICFSKEFRRHLENSDRRSWKTPKHCYHYLIFIWCFSTFLGWNECEILSEV